MPKTYDKKAWLEQKELTKEENLKIIQNIVNNFKEDPEKILEFIDFQSRFYNYSTHNTILIYAQNPGALFVGSFAAIKKVTDELAKEHKLPNGELTILANTLRAEQFVFLFVYAILTIVTEEDRTLCSYVTIAAKHFLLEQQKYLWK